MNNKSSIQVVQDSGRYPLSSENIPLQRYNKTSDEGYYNSSKIKDSRKKLSENNSHVLTNNVLKKYSRQYKNLSHVKINESTNGFLYEKNGKVVGIINTEKNQME